MLLARRQLWDEVLQHHEQMFPQLDQVLGGWTPSRSSLPTTITPTHPDYSLTPSPNLAPSPPRTLKRPRGKNKKIEITPLTCPCNGCEETGMIDYILEHIRECHANEERSELAAVAKRAHRFMVKGAKTFPCMFSTCSSGYSRKRDLRRHYHSKHTKAELSTLPEEETRIPTDSNRPTKRRKFGSQTLSGGVDTVMTSPAADNLDLFSRFSPQSPSLSSEEGIDHFDIFFNTL
eukprot:TRINITY_DN551_c0_g1_i2.p1 TRINITY_DN551_c0_g1~~TRINITY_DN551_c0_g1_i2.p1  ORF type:complete len:270 (+),score=76.77 TRINITY_DN551_c0_g1_i2:112-810(+)